MKTLMIVMFVFTTPVLASYQTYVYQLRVSNIYPPTCSDSDVVCQIAKTIYLVQTSPRGNDRVVATSQFENWSCKEYPEIMSGLDYAMNDTNEDVRRMAAVQIGYQILQDGSCCSVPVKARLENAVSQDPVDEVRDEAKKALGHCS